MEQFINIKCCIRTKHSFDMPLKKATMKCKFREGEECSIYPAYLKYMDANGMHNIWAKHERGMFTIKFRCILFPKKE